MTKKTKLIPFDYELYKKGAKAVFSDEKNKILGIFKNARKLDYLVVIEDDDSKINSWFIYEESLRLESEIEERTFWVNVYRSMEYTQTAIKYYSLQDAIKNRDHDSLGTLKITYTEEDLIK